MKSLFPRLCSHWFQALCAALLAVCSQAVLADEARAVAELESALQRWIEATNAGDFDSQRLFYPARMQAFYLWRNVPQSEVLKEKRRVFERAKHIDIDAERPQIILDESGRRARMYFRKVYEIRGPRVSREGEVLQELRWIRTTSGWKIDSERDLFVIR